MHLHIAVGFHRFLGDVVGNWTKSQGFWGKERSNLSVAALILFPSLFLALALYFRQSHMLGTLQMYLYLVVGGTLLSFSFAANALVRFRGTHDRTALILAFGFTLSGIIETIGFFHLSDLLTLGTAGLSHIPMGWMVGRTLLGVFLLTTLAVERFVPTARQPSRELVAAFFVVAAASYLTSIALLAAPEAPLANSHAFFSRPWELLPAAIFLASTVFFYQRYREGKKQHLTETSLYDFSLFLFAALNLACHVAALFSQRLLDGPFFLAEVCKVSSYLVLLIAALVDQARTFDQVRAMAVSDPLTGLANYRRLIGVLESELDRSRRTHRPFSVLLLDMDGLKVINDRHGHLVGSRALVRLGKILKSHSRTIDTPARYGGDEFAVVLPESTKEMAARVASRIREQLSADAEQPALSVSVGFASFPEDGDSPEKLLNAADSVLYRMKSRNSAMQSLTRIAACL